MADDSLMEAAASVAAGNFDTDLGGHVFKQRVARAGQGKSGGFRTIILFKACVHSVFAYGFAKNEKANITAKELAALKRLAAVLLGFSEIELARAIESGELTEVKENDGEAQEG